MDELKIIINQKAGTISTNFEEVKAALTDQMKIYEELKVSESNKPKRKKDIATLRKMIKAVTEKKTLVRNECLKPSLEFNKGADELIDIINNPINLIDYQVKEFEDVQRKQKMADIKSIYDGLIGELKDDISLDFIYGDKWLNVGTTLSVIEKEITDKVKEINQAVEIIKGMASDITEKAIDSYFSDLDLPRTISSITRYEQQKKEIQARLEAQQRADREREIIEERMNRERQLEVEKEKIRNEERAKIREEERIKEKALEDARMIVQAEQMEKERKEHEAMEIQKQANQSKMFSINYTISATSEEFAQVDMYLDSIGVDFKRGNDLSQHQS